MAKAKLNQVIAIEKGVKAKVYGGLTDLNKVAQKPDLFNGFTKTYKPLDEEGEKLPPDNRRVQFSVRAVIESVERGMTELMEVTARKDWTNCVAKGDVVVDDKVLIAGCPVSNLLFMEKQLTDLRTLVNNLPVLDVSEDWTKDENSGLYKTAVTQTHRTKKIQKSLVLLAPTLEHPGQAQLITDDVLVGYWSQTKQSGALPAPDKQRMLKNIDTLVKAVKVARESANMADEVDTPAVGPAIFEFVFGKQ